MAIDPDDPGLVGYTPVEQFRETDIDRSSRAIRDIPNNPLPAAVDDVAAKLKGVKLYDFYQNAGAVRQRLV